MSYLCNTIDLFLLNKCHIFSYYLYKYFMIVFFKYLFISENKKLYKEIAHQFKSSKRNVYKLAHGKKAKNYKDYSILKELSKRQIIEGVNRE